MKGNRTLQVMPALLAAALLAGCSSKTTDNATVAVAGDVPIAYAKRATAMGMNPTNGARSPRRRPDAAREELAQRA